jgi:hypothetical protein
VTFDRDPTPLTDAGSGASPWLRELLEAGTRDLPSAADLGRVEAKLLPLFTPPAAAPAPAASGALMKAGVAALGGVIVVGGLWLTQAPSTKPDRVEQREAPAPAANPAPVAAEASPAVPAKAETEPPVQEGAADTTAPPVTTPRHEKAGPKTPAPSAPVPEDVLLEQARRALASDPGRALSLAREHAAGYPSGVLAQEREVIAIEALRRLGRTSEAEKRLQRFERLYPQSAHRRKLEQPTK